MKPEKALRIQVLHLLKEAGLDPMAVENDCKPGTPDVECVLGWVELKCLPDWPRGEGTPVRIPHLRPAQRMWLSRRFRAGGRASLLLTIGKEWLLFLPPVVAIELGRLPKHAMLAKAHRYSLRAPLPQELNEWLKSVTPS